MDLAECEGYSPVELFSRNKFPIIKKQPYVITLGPHGYYWFEISKEQEVPLVEAPIDLSILLEVKKWDDLFVNKKREILENKIFPSYITKRRWFNGDKKGIESLKIHQNITISNSKKYNLLLLEVQYFQ